MTFPDFPGELRERLLLEPEGFDSFLDAYLGAVDARPCGVEQIEFALGYPWARPEASYVLGPDGEVLPPDPALATDRHPILAFGSNGAPSQLQRKFAHFADPDDRTILVVAGDLHDFDVGPAAAVAAYGAMPATLFPSPGTRVRAAVLFATDNQATQLTWTELNYRVGRIDTRFDAEVEVTSALAYVSRFGTFCPDGEPAALQAIPAHDRTAAAWTQRDLLDRVAELTGKTSAEDVVAAVHRDLHGFQARVREHIRPRAQPFVAPGWTPFA